ncbi:unnamed protein product [Pedinophyceae sp. YPF-701]|nr:unnamed protein product [Pedinophyceae sp. YPF-701]
MDGRDEPWNRAVRLDVIATLFAAGGSLVWVKIFDGLASAGYLEQKLSRKIVHITTGPLFLLTWPAFGDAAYSPLCAALVPALNACRLFAIGSGIVVDEGAVRSLSREGDNSELLRGPLYYCLAMTAATVLCWRGSAVGFTSLSLMCGGDGFADIVGRRLGGKARIPWNPKKSVAGSAAMFVAGLCMSVAFLQYFTSLGYMNADVAGSLPALAAVAAAATLVESLPVSDKLDDNLSVPLATYVAGFLLLGQNAV